MPIDSSIALQVRPPQLDDPTAVRAKQLQLRDLMSQGQMRDMQMQQAQRAQQEEMRFADLYRGAVGPDGQIDYGKLTSGAASAGMGARIPGLQKQQAEVGKAMDERTKAKFELVRSQYDAVDNAMRSLLSDPELSTDKVIGLLSAQAQSYRQFPEMIEKLGQEARNLPPDPGRLRQYLMQKLIEGQKGKEQLDALLPKAGTIDAGNRVIPTQTNQITGEMTQGQPIVKAPEGFVVGQGGGLSADPGFLNAKKQIAAAGKTSVNLNVNTAKDLTSEMATGLGKQLDASRAAAQSGVTAINTADQIRRIAGSGKAITGPLADARLVVARLGDALGVTGADTKEKLANTAALVQGLAKSELDAAQAMKGQGQITEAERAILRRAASGDLNMSPSELMTLAGGIDKTARARIKSHKQETERLRTLPGAEPLVPFYGVEEPAAAPSGTPPDIDAILQKYK